MKWRMPDAALFCTARKGVCGTRRVRETGVPEVVGIRPDIDSFMHVHIIELFCACFERERGFYSVKTAEGPK